MKLYGGALSPYFARCVLVLQMKDQAGAVTMPGVPGMRLGSPEMLAQNPLGKIPYLELDDGTILPEGQVICDYFDSLFPDPALKPADAAGRARSDLLTRLLDVYALPFLISAARGLGSGRGADDPGVASDLARLADGLGAFDHFFTPGEWAMGDNPGMVDCALIPMIWYGDTFLSGAGIDVFAPAPLLSAYVDDVRERPEATGCFAMMKKSMERVRAAQAQQADN